MSHTRKARAGGVAMVVLAGVIASFSQGAIAVTTARVHGTPQTPIKHIVFILKENRSFDGYFGALPGVNGATSATCWQNGGGTRTIDPLPITPDPMPQDISHSPSSFVQAYHGGAMNGFCHEYGAVDTKTGQDLADTQMHREQIPNYWSYAEHYGIGDNMFASWRGASFANNIFMLAGQAGRYDPSLGYRTVSGLPLSPSTKPLYSWGCDDPADTTVQMLGVDGSTSYHYPCFSFATLPSLLDRYQLPWRFYADEGHFQFIHASPNAFGYLRCPDATVYPCAKSPYWNQHVPPSKQIFTDAAANNLPAVSWYLPFQTEHPPKTACAGESSTVTLLNALMQSPEWSSTAVVVIWDEWGGFYDHVRPPTAAGSNTNVSYGFRVPLLVISPWVKSGTLADGGRVGHSFFAHPSLLRFVEKNWALPTLGAADDPTNYVAGEPVPGSLMGFFDFSDPLNPPKPGPFILTPQTCPGLSPAQRADMRAANPD
jgi:phospholipase C